MNKNIRKGITGLLVALSLVAVAPIAAHAEWKSNSTGWWYQNGGSYYANGWYNVGGSWYYFRSNGYMATGWVQSGGNWYYCLSNGKMASNGWIQDGGNWYYMQSDGSMARNTYIGSYYVNSSGVWTTSGGNKYQNSGTNGKVTSSSDGSLSDSLQKGGN